MLRFQGWANRQTFGKELRFLDLFTTLFFFHLARGIDNLLIHDASILSNWISCRSTRERYSQDRMIIV